MTHFEPYLEITHGKRSARIPMRDIRKARRIGYLLALRFPGKLRTRFVTPRYIVEWSAFCFPNTAPRARDRKGTPSATGTSA